MASQAKNEEITLPPRDEDVPKVWKRNRCEFAGIPTDIAPESPDGELRRISVQTASTAESDFSNDSLSFSMLEEDRASQVIKESRVICGCSEKESLPHVTTSKSPLTSSEEVLATTEGWANDISSVPSSKSMPNIKSCVLPIVSDEKRSKCSERLTRSQSVSFHSINIREYDMTLGDNPSCSNGLPLALDWNYKEFEPLSVDDYESNRGSRRTSREQMTLSYFQRRHLLKMFEVPVEDILQAEEQLKKAKKERFLTVRFLRFGKIEEIYQSTKRKTKRLFQKIKR